jgi:hypothetical protein
LEAVQLNDAGIPLQNLQLVAPGRPAPLCAADVALVESEGVAAARGLPAQAVLSEPALALFPGQVQVDIVKALPVAPSVASPSKLCSLQGNVLQADKKMMEGPSWNTHMAMVSDCLILVRRGLVAMDTADFKLGFGGWLARVKVDATRAKLAKARNCRAVRNCGAVARLWSTEYRYRITKYKSR